MHNCSNDDSDLDRTSLPPSYEPLLDSSSDPSSLVSSHEHKSEIDSDEDIVWQHVRSTIEAPILPVAPTSEPVPATAEVAVSIRTIFRALSGSAPLLSS